MMLKRGKLFIFVILLVVLLAGCSAKEDMPEKKEDLATEGVVSEKDLLVVEGYIFNQEHYHAIEFHKDKIYALYEWTNPADEDDWMDALLSFSPYEGAKLICQGRYLDFRASDKGKYVAVRADEDIEFYSKDGKLIHTVSKDEMNIDQYTMLQIDKWNDDGDVLWCGIMETFNTIAYISIDTKTWEREIYDGLDFDSNEYVLNPNTGWVLYSDYPFIFDPIDAEEYKKSKELTTLSIYNLMSGERIDIDSHEANEFKAEWMDDNEIIYYKGYEINFYEMKR